MQLIDNPQGGYQFIKGIAPYSAGVRAAPGYDIVRVTLHAPQQYHVAFAAVDRYLAAHGLPRAALCAVELRTPAPWTFAGFAQFNAEYQRLLTNWNMFVDGMNPIARTNVAPQVAAPLEPSLYAFSFSAPSRAIEQHATFVVAGAGELPEGVLSDDAIVRAGESSPAAIEAKATFVMSLMQARLIGLGVSGSDVTAVDLYTVHSPAPFLAERILTPLGPAAVHGVHWHYCRPPVQGLEFEMDMRGVRQELWI